jgi:hypothetical protein
MLIIWGRSYKRESCWAIGVRDGRSERLNPGIDPCPLESIYLHNPPDEMAFDKRLACKINLRFKTTKTENRA